MTQIETFQYFSFKIQGICINGDPWFRGKDIATVLGYADTKKSIAKNVDDNDRQILSDLLALTNEGGISESPLDVGGTQNTPWTPMQKLNIY